MPQPRGVEQGSAQPVWLWQPGDDAARVLTFAHAEQHEGEAYLVSHLTESIADNGTIEFVIRPGDKLCHLIFDGACGGDARLELFESPVIVGGTIVTPQNKRRDAANANLANVTQDPATVSDDGTLLQGKLIPGGTGGNAVGGQGGQRDEWILKQNTPYLVRLTNIAGNAQPASLEIEWYEHNLE